MKPNKDALRGFKGIWIPEKLINSYGWRIALKIASCYYKAPGWEKILKSLTKYRTCAGLPDSRTIKDIILKEKGTHICEWCNNECYCTHDHHYPILKKDGGTLTVKICGKCHADFHLKYNENIRIFKTEIREMFEVINGI